MHILSTQFLEKLRLEGWDQAKSYFRDRRQEAKGNLSGRQLRCASLDASVLIIPVHGSIHWNPLIRDCRGVGIEKARWRFFDTKATDARLKWVQETIRNTPLWMEDQTWETVDTPQQFKDDCGPMTGAISVSYVRWSSNLKISHERLNSNDISLTNPTDATELGKATRKFARETVTKGRLPRKDNMQQSRTIDLQPLQETIEFGGIRSWNKCKKQAAP